jgi:small subunit ribosomal protein S20
MGNSSGHDPKLPDVSALESLPRMDTHALTAPEGTWILRGLYSDYSIRAPDFQETPLANSAQARKRARQSEDRRQQNASQRSTLRTFMKKVIKAIQAGDKEAAVQAFKDAVPRIDRAARKGLIHANKAARHKSRMNAHIKGMS